MCMFQPCRRIGTWTFRLRGRLGTRTFRHGDFLAQGFFGTMDISGRGHFGTVSQVPKCLCQKVHIALQGAKISRCRNVQALNILC